MRSMLCLLAVGALAFGLLSACNPRPISSGQRVQCANGLNAGYRELEQARLKGLGGTVALTKAASLLGAAKVQQQFDKFPNCINKVKRARIYIRNARTGG